MKKSLVALPAVAAVCAGTAKATERLPRYARSPRRPQAGARTEGSPGSVQLASNCWRWPLTSYLAGQRTVALAGGGCYEGVLLKEAGQGVGKFKCFQHRTVEACFS